MNSFGGQNGGGFMMNNSPGMGSQGSPRSKGRRDGNRSFTSLTIAQINQASKPQDAESAEFWLDGRELASINIVGVIRDAKPESTKSTYRIDDCTGFIEVTMWHDNTDDEAQRRAQFAVDKTVRVFGKISAFKDIRRISAFKIVPVNDMNVVSFHMLECIAHHLFAKKAPATVSGAGSLGFGSTSAGTGSMPDSSAYGQQASTGQNYTNMTRDQNLVHSAIQSITTDEGASVQEVVSQLSGSLSEEKIRETIDWLSDEGHIYSTVDEDHYRSVQEND